MTLPATLVLVRHGESEGNVANRLSRRGDHSAFTPEFTARHSASWRLTGRGIEQAQQTGAWVRANVGATFSRYYSSPYLRARETAVHLDLPEATWYLEPSLRERDWGRIDVMSNAERDELYARAIADRDRDPLLWTPPDGESYHDVDTRLRAGILDTLHREVGGGTAVLVCHGEVMSVLRMRLERLSPEQWHARETSPEPGDQIRNGQVLWYTRVDPKTRQEVPYLGWWRSVCPWAAEDSGWQPILRRGMSNAELAASVEEASTLALGRSA